MLHVYLDQNKWIELARARVGKSPELEPVLRSLVQAMEAGTISFPLSSIHYMENWNSRAFKHRNDVAETMLLLSRRPQQIRPDAIAPPSEIVPMEIDLAISATLTRSVEPRMYPIFGQGAGHAFGKPVEYRIPLELRDRVPNTAAFEEMANAALEEACLKGPSENFPVAWLDTERYKNPSQTYLKREQDLKAKFLELGLDKARRDELLLAGSILDILEPLQKALLRAGISPEQFTSMGTIEARRFLRCIPSRWVDYELHRLRHANPGTKRDRGDLADMSALSIAVVYCDVVVTERHWCDMIARSSLTGIRNARMLSDLRELPSTFSVN